MHALQAGRSEPPTGFLTSILMSRVPMTAPVTIGTRTLLAARSRALLWRFVVVAALTITAGALVMWLQTRRIIEPLVRLTSAAETITTGERPIPAPIPFRVDEVGRLDRAFRTPSLW